MKKIKSLIFILIIIVVIIIAIILIKDNKFKEENNVQIKQQTQNENNISKSDIKQVTNPHMYFTVKSCAEKYISYLQLKDKKSLEIILDNSYINNFNITQDNILNYVEKIDTMVTLSIDKMYVLNEDDEIQTYYLVGNLMRDTYEDNNEYNEGRFCVTIILDTNNDIYSVIPFGYGGPLYEQI